MAMQSLTILTVLCGIFLLHVDAVRAQEASATQGRPENWMISAIVLPCLFVGLALIFCLIGCCGSKRCCGADCEDCCEPMCGSEACCGPRSCCGPMCDPQSCCGPTCCGPCCYQHMEAPAPVIKSSPYVTRSPIWPQQHGTCNNFSFPSAGVTTGRSDRGMGGMGSHDAWYGIGKSMDANYSSGKEMFAGCEAKCGPCGQGQMGGGKQIYGGLSAPSAPYVQNLGIVSKPKYGGGCGPCGQSQGNGFHFS